MKKATQQTSSKNNSSRRPARTVKPIDSKELVAVTGGWGQHLGSGV